MSNYSVSNPNSADIFGASSNIVKGVYCIHDNVSGENGAPVFCISDESFMRDFGIAFSKYDVPASMANQWTGIKLGTLIVPNDPHSFPRLVGYDCPAPICSAAEAMAMYRDFAPVKPASDEEESENG